MLNLCQVLEKEPAKKRRISQTERKESPEPDLEPAYQHLKAVTRKVSRQTIEMKWDSLPPNCVELISQLLQDIQRPVVVRLNDERKRNQASTALQMISRRLVNKIQKGLPFPQGTRNHREDDFDFEKILDQNRALEAQLTLALHANELLEAELGKEITWLEAEKEKLAELEANARSEAAVRNAAARKLHPLLQSKDSTTEIQRIKDIIGLDIVDSSPTTNFNVSRSSSIFLIENANSLSDTG